MFVYILSPISTQFCVNKHIRTQHVLATKQADNSPIFIVSDVKSTKESMVYVMIVIFRNIRIHALKNIRPGFINCCPIQVYIKIMIDTSWHIWTLHYVRMNGISPSQYSYITSQLQVEKKTQKTMCSLVDSRQIQKVTFKL